MKILLLLLLLISSCPTQAFDITRFGRENRWFGDRFPPLPATDLFARRVDIRRFPRVPLLLLFLQRGQLEEGRRWLRKLPRDLLFGQDFIPLVILDGVELRGLGPRGNVIRIARRRCQKIIRDYEKILDRREREALRRLPQVWMVDWENDLKKWFGVEQALLPIILMNHDLKIIAYFDHFDLDIYDDIYRAIRRRGQS